MELDYFSKKEKRSSQLKKKKKKKMDQNSVGNARRDTLSSRSLYFWNTMQLSQTKNQNAFENGAFFPHCFKSASLLLG